MFNLGFSELLILAVIALIFIGPKQLPEVAKVIGRLINEWKRATSDITSSFTNNEAYRDWENRKNRYMTEMEEQKVDPPSVETKEPDDPNQLELKLDEDIEKKDS